MYGFRALCVSFSSFACIIFQRCVFSFRVQFSVLLINDLFLATTYGVYYDYCALRQFATVRGIVVSLRCFENLLYFS